MAYGGTSFVTTAPAPTRPMDPYPSLALRLASAIRGRPIGASRPAETSAAPQQASAPRAAMSLPGQTVAQALMQPASANGTELSVPSGGVFSAPAPVLATPEPVVPTVAEIVEDPALRALVREIIGEELHGELGTRFARNLRAVIRREVAAAIEDQMDRF